VGTGGRGVGQENWVRIRGGGTAGGPALGCGGFFGGGEGGSLFRILRGVFFYCCGNVGLR